MILKKLGIDPGHGLSNNKAGVYDPGSTARGQAEASIALAWALTLKHIATEAGIPCWLTRTSRDFAAPRLARVARAVANDCTHLISIHCNEVDDEDVRGTETFYRAGKNSSKNFADLVNDAAVAGFRSRDEDWKDRGIKPDTQSQHSGGLAILKGSLTSALIELGFQSSPDDLSQLIVVEARVAVCTSIVSALKELV